MWLGVIIRKSTWMFPVIETFHLFALALLLGAVLIVSLRIWRLILPRQTLAYVAGEFANLMTGSLSVMLLTGLLLFLSEASKCYQSPPFRA